MTRRRVYHILNFYDYCIKGLVIQITIPAYVILLPLGFMQNNNVHIKFIIIIITYTTCSLAYK